MGEDFMGCDQTAFDLMQAEIAHLQAENEALREANRWIPVGERLPDAGVDVLIYCAPPLDMYWVGQIRNDGVWAGIGGVGIRNLARAWQPLPAPPEPQAVPAKTGRECPSCDNDEVFSDGDDQIEGALHRCEQCGKLAAISVTAGRYTLVDAPEPQAVPERES